MNIISTIQQEHVVRHIDLIVETNQQQEKLEISLEDLDNGWIPKEDILKWVDEVRARNDKKDNTASSSTHRYRPSLLKYPLKNLQNITTQLTSTDVIFFWHIPKASGTSVKKILSGCFELTRAEMRLTPQTLELVGKNIINFDTSTIAGIAQAKHSGFVDSGYVDAIVSSYLHEGSALFTERHRGRLFTMMRHPVETAISLFSYLGSATWERNYNPELANMTLLDYTQSNNTALRIDNWMTRYLARKIKGDLKPAHLKLAKEILEHKCLIGMVDHFVESMERIRSYFGLMPKNEINSHIKSNERKQARGMKCVEEYNKKKTNKHWHVTYKPGDIEWDLLAKKNRYDMELYKFATELWDRQANIFKNNGKKPNDHSLWSYRKPPP